MERITLHVEPRTESGKGTARSLRRNGYIPAVVYRSGRSVPIKLSRQEVVNLLNATIGAQVMVNLKFADGKSKLALLKDYQVDPVRGELLHTDFYEVSLKEKVKVTVAVALVGEAVAVKKEGAIMQQVLSEIEVECLPDKIPPHLEVDVSSLSTGDTLHVSDLTLPEGVRVLTDVEEAIATVIMPAVEVEEEVVPEVTEEEEVEEPEVVKKGKKEEAEEEEQ